ncbi:MAG TPA: hypothetical protein PLC48_07010 [Ferruginibacter sp.]|nr:hypothetical protein [Ferruginibacter sp.]
MKTSTFFIVALLLVASCKQGNKSGKDIQSVKDTMIAEQPEVSFFFPVTSYIQGQIFDIKKNARVNPLKITSINNKIDSSWLKMEDIDKELTEFLSPKIDSGNFTAFFSEKKFLDQTLGAVTLTYDPLKSLPDSIYLKHWDVYIDPESNEVKRIYLLKKSNGKTIQLTWQSGKWCKQIFIAPDAAGNEHVEKEITIKWDL